MGFTQVGEEFAYTHLFNTSTVCGACGRFSVYWCGGLTVLHVSGESLTGNTAPVCHEKRGDGFSLCEQILYALVACSDSGF